MRALLCVVAWLAIASPASAQLAESSPIPLGAYLEALDRVSADVRRLGEQPPEAAMQLAGSLPLVWRVEASGRTYEVSAAWLRRDLSRWRVKRDVAVQAQMLQHLALMRAEAATVDALPPDSAPVRTALTEILAQPEFKNLRGPGWFERLRQRAMELLLSLLKRTFGASATSTVINVIGYVLIGLAVVLVGQWMYRSLKRTARVEAVLSGGVSYAARPWTAWLADAHAAAGSGAWRDAVRAAYWCGVSFLESQGAWRPDRSRTPREYLRELPATSDQAPPLRDLTRLLEIVWYGAGAADATRFDDALAHLKRLGCPSV